MNEVCYVSEILLFVGRKVSNKKEEVGDNSKAFCGIVPSFMLNDLQNEIQSMIKADPDLQKQNDIATKAYNKFIKTRQSASKSSVKNSHTVETEKIHPIFQ